jgi:hypothetical protein
VEHQEAVVSHRQDVGVERAAVDAGGRLLREEAGVGMQLVQPRQRV